MSELRSILLAEDDPRDAELTLYALGEHGLANEVVHVRDGVEALDYLYRRGAWAGRDTADPAAVLLDLRMPRLDGLDVLRVLRADEALRGIPVVVMTSSRQEREIVEKHRAGMNGLVSKPVDFRDLVDCARTTGVTWAMIPRAETAPGRASA
jgi:CheY-like chemotaxis protein